MLFENTARLIKLARIRAGLTQEDFAKLLDLESAQFVSNIEQGRAALPAKRAKRIHSLLSKEALLSAYVKDITNQWREEYGR